MVLARSAAVTLSLICAAWSSAAVTRCDEPSSLPKTDVHRGRDLFERVWEPDKTGDGDGLGPLFNERSCVACHLLGGVGGAGPNSKNVDLLTVVLSDDLKAVAKNLRTSRGAQVDKGIHRFFQLERSVALIHSGLRTGGTMLHTFGTDPRYAMFREQVLGLVPLDDALKPTTASLFQEVRLPPGNDPQRTIVHGDITLKFSQRNSTAMFGAGLIDRIPQTVLKDIADEQERDGKVSGRVLGRFGWRGQTPNLTDFVKGACTTELGLDVEGIPRPADPVRATLANREAARRSGKGSGRSGGDTRKVVDLDERQVADMVAFVATLPAPDRRLPADEAGAAAVRHGETVFAAVGCADCHRPTVASVAGIYSDLLMHDMGSRLEDAQGAPARAESGLYYPASRSLGDLFALLTQEWRTPPLWGLADSAPYMHDGRAQTIAAAIRWHGGEAQNSLDKYVALEQVERDDLDLFLHSLVAPDVPELKQRLVRVSGGSNSDR